MFFHYSVFNDAGLDEDTAIVLAKIANQTLDDNCQLIYGEYLSNGQASNFTTEKKRTDTHCALLLGVALMGDLKPHDATVALERPLKKDMERLLQERNKQLERHNAMLTKRETK